MHRATKLVSLLLSVSACGAVAVTKLDDSAHFEVAGRQFDVPQDYLFAMRFFWLPAGEEDSFTFLLEPRPDDNRIPAHRILVQRLSRLCPADPDIESQEMLRIACGQVTPRVSDAPPYTSVQDEDAPWASYLLAVEADPGKDGVRSTRPIASCQYFEPNPANPEGSNLCSTFWADGGLLLTFSFDETRASQLPEMKAQAFALLDQWERH